MTLNKIFSHKLGLGPSALYRLGFSPNGKEVFPVKQHWLAGQRKHSLQNQNYWDTFAENRLSLAGLWFLGLVQPHSWRTHSALPYLTLPLWPHFSKQYDFLTRSTPSKSQALIIQHCFKQVNLETTGCVVCVGGVWVCVGGVGVCFRLRDKEKPVLLLCCDK